MSKLLKDSYSHLLQQLIKYDESARTNGILDRAKVVCQNITFAEYYANVIKNSDPGELTKWVNTKYSEIINREGGFINDDRKMCVIDDAAWLRRQLIRRLTEDIHMHQSAECLHTGHVTEEIDRLKRLRLVYENITDEEFRDHILYEIDPDEIRMYVDKKFIEFTKPGGRVHGQEYTAE